MTEILRQQTILIGPAGERQALPVSMYQARQIAAYLNSSLDFRLIHGGGVSALHVNPFATQVAIDERGLPIRFRISLRKRQ